eukprot:CAMPEP_0185830268 /NCGR_PEP_ID=MMETSP1353-20130828/726_1 /TAXON_ID=1077150 /ORGANISM="Erythrolobus australicus, Strain CCMP3124" /LENGTH=219 /DNA_ID=CAMNT_0028528145 /DNA_START=298 /DNA_END=957 /DNA_ORIENTATION=-
MEQMAGFEGFVEGGAAPAALAQTLEWTDAMLDNVAGLGTTTQVELGGMVGSAGDAAAAVMHAQQPSSAYAVKTEAAQAPDALLNVASDIGLEEDEDAETGSREPRKRSAEEAVLCGEESLAGTTAEKARMMTSEEKEVMLMKRKLRNRESAKRSRARLNDSIAQLSRETTELERRVSQSQDLINSITHQNALLRSRISEGAGSIAPSDPCDLPAVFPES